MDKTIDVGDNIRIERERNGWTLTELAKRVTTSGHSMSFSRLGKLERGALRIDVETLIAIADALAIAPGRLLEKPPELSKTKEELTEHLQHMRRLSNMVKLTTADEEESREAVEQATAKLHEATMVSARVWAHLNQVLLAINATITKSGSTAERLAQSFPDGWERRVLLSWRDDDASAALEEAKDWAALQTDTQAVVEEAMDDARLRKRKVAT